MPIANLGRNAGGGRGLAWLLLVTCALLAACAGPTYTVDDGRKVDEALLTQIRTYGQAERAVRPAIARTAALKDPDCDKQWELPFAVVSSDGWTADERVAWVRGLGVDERLTVVGAAPGSPVAVGDKLEEIDGLHRPKDGEGMSMRLVRARDQGMAFMVRAAGKPPVKVQPFQVCRGYTRFAPPNTPQMQDYHWLMSLHPLEAAAPGLSDDEALWVVLWTQGLSEEGGVRMKAWHYTTKVVGTIYSIASLASGLKGAALAADQAMKAAQSAAAKAATDVIREQLLTQARNFAAQKAREGVADAGEKLVRQQAMDAMQRAAMNRGRLAGVSRIGATVFDRADRWAYERAGQLHGNPLAGFSLHQRLVEAGANANAFVFDIERLTAISALADKNGQAEAVAALLKGVDAQALQFALEGMPLASAPAAFRYDDGPADSSSPFARGLVDAMLEMPVKSGSGGS